MDPVTLVIVGFAALLVAGYTQRFRASAAMKRTWETTTNLPDPLVEAAIRRGLRGLLPGRVHGTVADGHLRRTIRRWALQASSSATVGVSVRESEDEPGVRVVVAELTDAQAETVFGMVHPVWCAPLAAQRRARSVQRHLVKAASDAR